MIRGYRLISEGGRWRWQKRQRRQQYQSVGRVYAMLPSAGDIYYFRLIMLDRCGITSHLEAATVSVGRSSRVFATFRETAVFLGLAMDDGEWDRALTEAVTHYMPAQLRQLFAFMLTLDPPACSVRELWDKHKVRLGWECFRARALLAHMASTRTISLTRGCDGTLAHPTQVDMCEDILIRERDAQDLDALPELTEDFENEGLRRLQSLVEANNKSMQDVNMPTPPPLSSAAAAATAGVGGATTAQRLIDQHSGADNQDRLARRVRRVVEHLNHDQRNVLNSVKCAVLQRLEGGCAASAFFVDSPGGCGKTHVFNHLLDTVRSMGRVALAVASSGIAVLLLHGGRTAHSMLKIPIPIQRHCHLDFSSAHATLLRETVLLVWDEAPMMHKECFEAVSDS